MYKNTITVHFLLVCILVPLFILENTRNRKTAQVSVEVTFFLVGDQLL
jgi:hypothetical protein